MYGHLRDLLKTAGLGLILRNYRDAGLRVRREIGGHWVIQHQLALLEVPVKYVHTSPHAALYTKGGRFRGRPWVVRLSCPGLNYFRAPSFLPMYFTRSTTRLE